MSEILRNFVIFEGGDGSGRTTQLERLKAREVPGLFTTAEPTDGLLGLAIREALSGKLHFEGETMAWVFAGDRACHLYHTPRGDAVVDRCRRGELVVMDRYVPSSIVYQGLMCGEKLPRALNEVFPLPELCFFFDLAPEKAMERIAARSEREIFENPDFQARVRSAYLRFLPEYEAAGVRVVRLDASLPVDEVSALIWSELKKLPILKTCLS